MNAGQNSRKSLIRVYLCKSAAYLLYVVEGEIEFGFDVTGGRAE
jgi:hypothetical protein